ncbi:MAG: FlgD immunoglobulin-like domain containing protein [Candidatus Kapaibacterium sp.]
MRFKVLLLLVSCALAVAVYAGDSGKGNEAQRRSNLYKNGSPGSYPRPFSAEPATITKTTIAPAVSTGYYIVDSDDNADTYWKPYGFISPNNEVDLNYQPETWRKVVSGPHQFPPSYWVTNTAEGLPYFQNPANVTAALPNGIDSTDDAFAGPIPIGFPFYFNGIRYDSFYVSTNGMMALSNRRYFYGDDGSRVQRDTPSGQSFYDPEAEDSRAPQGASGATDPTPDDWGYRCVALGLAPGIGATNWGTGSATGGLRNPANGGLNGFANFTNGAPVIAPFWGSTQMSVYNSNVNFIDDFASVRYKRSVSGDKLIIWFQNVTPRGTWTAYLNGAVWGTYTYNANIRPGSTNFIQGSAAVVMNRLDSSVCVYFTDFQGVAFINNRPFTAANMFRMNTTLGVRGIARHYNYNSLTSTGGSRTNYAQYTVYYTNNTVYSSGSAQEDLQTPSTGLIVCFKQWKNTVRAVTTEYKVKPRDPNAALDYTVTVPSANVNNFEILAGDQRLGGIVPIAVFQNLSNDIQSPVGVNYQPQNIKFRARFRIVNQATGGTVYNRLVNINSFFSDNSNFTVGGYRLGTFSAATPPVFSATTPAPTSNGVPPYAYVQVQFSPFEPNEFIDNQIGRFRAFIIAEPVDSSGQGFRDSWPFDDTTTFTLFVMRRLSSFNEDIREYHVISGVPMPSVLKFVNIGGEVNDGDATTNNPPPPRGEYAAANNTFFKLQTPVVQLNRIIDNAEPPTSPGGDELRSFPIDIRGRKGAVLSLAYHRTEKQNDYPRGWADNTLVGPEPRVAYLEGGTTAQAGGGTQSPGIDEVWVEFARPSRDQVNNIVVSSVPGASAFEWNFHPKCCNQAAITDNPAWSIFGGGGYRRGFSAADKDTALTKAQGLFVDLYDDGKDFEWRKVYVPIPDTVINAPNDGARNFRFRLNVRAYRHAIPQGPSDDQDNFFFKNIRILFPSEVTDIEALSVIATWPYRETPASQGTNIPLRVRIANNTGRDAQAFKVEVYIMDESEVQKPVPIDWATQKYVYARSVTIPFLGGNRDVEVPFPSWNARESNNAASNNYYIATKITYPGGDLEPLNDETYSRFTMRFGPSFSYHDPNETNQVPQFTTPFFGQTLVGKGLNTLGFASSVSTQETAFGANGGSGSGQIAVRFNLSTQDTLFGFQAYFCSLNSDQNNTRFAVYVDQASVPATSPINGSVMYTQRGLGIENDGQPTYDAYTTYLYPKPLVLQPGTYWISVAQLSTVGMELGATGARSGFQLGNYNVSPTNGATNINLYLDKNMRVRTRSGNLINDNRFAFENSMGSGQWQQFAPTTGNVGYPHLNYGGFIGAGANSYTRGTWLPMLRPYLGNRKFGPRKYYDPPKDGPVPVELTEFDGQKTDNQINLWWETASEKNNSGFYVERRSENEEQWKDITFVQTSAQNGTSASPLRYAYADNNVVKSTSYEYRLRQVDLDGSFTHSNVLHFTIDGDNTMLSQNSPNPVESTTNIPYTVAAKAQVRLEVVDVMGNVVRTLVNSVVDAGNQVAVWDGTDNNGVALVSGTYVGRLTIGDRVETIKMSVVR